MAITQADIDRRIQARAAARKALADQAADQAEVAAGRAATRREAADARNALELSRAKASAGLVPVSPSPPAVNVSGALSGSRPFAGLPGAPTWPTAPGLPPAQVAPSFKPLSAAAPAKLADQTPLPHPGKPA